MTVSTLPLAFVAGVLSILSPCVLPIFPSHSARQRPSIDGARRRSPEGSPSHSSQSGCLRQPSAIRSALTPASSATLRLYS